MSVIVSPADVDVVAASGLLTELDADLLRRYPGEPVNGIEPTEFRLSGGYFVLARVHGELAGCGAIRPHSQSTVEIKRMFVRAPFRGKGIGCAMLRALEAEARARGFAESILETAIRMPEAIALYRSCGYQVMEPYGQYVGSARSVAERALTIHSGRTRFAGRLIQAFGGDTPCRSPGVCCRAPCAADLRA